MVELTLPFPPSNNTYYRHVGHMVKISEKGRQYRADIAAAVLAQRGLAPMLAGPLRFQAVYHEPDRRRRDLDNLFKALMDALKHAGLYADDSQIRQIDARFGPEPVPGGAVSLILWPLSAPAAAVAPAAPASRTARSTPRPPLPTAAAGRTRGRRKTGGAGAPPSPS